MSKPKLLGLGRKRQHWRYHKMKVVAISYSGKIEYLVCNHCSYKISQLKVK